MRSLISSILVVLILSWILPQAMDSHELTQTSLQVSSSRFRDATCSASLPDGRSLVTGGNALGSSLTAAKYFERDGQLISVAPMLTARADHICIALKDGTVLVAGGITAKNESTS